MVTNFERSIKKDDSITVELLNNIVIKGKVTGINSELLTVIDEVDEIEKIIQVNAIVYFYKRPIITDKRDNRAYSIIKIGNQTWLAENLKYDMQNDSKAYDNDEANVEKYGRLYNKNGAFKACPEGWRIPTTVDWRELIRHIGSDYEPTSFLYTNKKIWDVIKKYEIFNAVPAGFCDNKGIFQYIEEFGFWHSDMIGLNSMLDDAERVLNKKKDNTEDNYFSVRCILKH